MMIELQILEPKHISNPKDVFVAHCVAVFGDGDDYKDIRLVPIQRTPGYEAQLEELVNLLDAMMNFAWVDDREYTDLPDFAKWFLNTDNGMDGSNPFLDDVFVATLDSYEITYYDRDGIEHAVSIRTES
jgi:hypothetical protein